MLKIKKIFETKKSLFGFSSFHLMKHQSKLNIIKRGSFSQNRKRFSKIS